MTRDEMFVDESGKHEARIVSWNNEWVYLERREIGSTRMVRFRLSRRFWESSSNGWRKRDAAT